MDQYVDINISSFSDLDFRITKKELIKYIKLLKNNKATSFDGISNEMLKAGMGPLSKPLLLLFNTLLDHNLYPTVWRKYILSHLHKYCEKNEQQLQRIDGRELPG